MMGIHHMMEFHHIKEFHNMTEFHNIMEFHHIMEFHYMMEFHHIMDIHNFIWFVKSLAVLTTYWYKMSLVKPLFVASPHPDDDQHELNHRPPSADGDPTDSGNLLQLLLANWCLQVGGAVQLLPLLQLQEEAVTSSATATPPRSNVSVLQQPSILLQRKLSCINNRKSESVHP